MINLPPCIAANVFLAKKKDKKYRIHLLFPKKWTNEWMTYLKRKCEEALIDETLSESPHLFPVVDGSTIKTNKHKRLYSRCHVVSLEMIRKPTVVDTAGVIISSDIISALDTVSANIEIVNRNDKLSFDCQTIQWIGAPEKGEHIVGTKTLLELASGHPELDITLNYPVKGFRVIPHTPIRKDPILWKYKEAARQDMEVKIRERRRIRYLREGR